MAEKDYAASKLINLHSADGTTLLIPKIPLSTVDNNAYTVVVDKETSATSIVTKGAGSSLQAAVQAEIAAAVADSVVGNYVPWADGSNVVIPGTLTVEGDTTLAGVIATDADITGTLDVTGKATLSDALDVAGAATLKGAVRVEGKLVAAQDMYIETTADGSTTSTKVATMADIDGITGGTLNNYYTKGEVDAIAEGTLEDANVYTDSASTALSAQITALDTKVTTDYATKVYVGEQIAAIDHLKREIVPELPTGEAIDTNTIYMVKMGDQGENVYREYMYIAGKWEIVGDSNIDFSNYYTKGEVDTKLGSYYTKGEIDAELADYVATDDFNGSIANYALTTYVDAQDSATLTSANTYADAAVSTASSALNAGIAAVDGKFANYYDKDGIAGLGYATVTQVNTASAAAVTEATGYTDQQLANYLDSTAASQAFILRDQIAQPYNHIVYTAEFGSHTFDLKHGAGDNRVTVYTSEGVDAKFAPLDGATLTNVVSITGDAAHIAVSKVTATELQIVNEVQLAGVIVGSDTEAPAARITEDGATFVTAQVTELLTVGDDAMQGSANIKGTLDATSINVANDVRIGSTLETNALDAGDGALAVNSDETGNHTVSMGSAFKANLVDNTVMIHDEWTDGETTSTGLAAVATEHDITSAVADANEYTDAASSNIMSTINALPGIGDGAILYDVIEEQI